MRESRPAAGTNFARLLLAGAALAVLAPERLLRNGPSLCAVRRLSGRPCPACGLTRSWNAAARLKLRDSWSFHPLGLPALAALGWAAFPRAQPGPRHAALRRAALSLTAAVWLAVYVRRLRGA